MMDWINHNGVWKLGLTPCKVAPVQVKHGEGQVPYEVAEEAYKEYKAQYGGTQSLERLCERGGFGCAELAILLYERIKRLEHMASVTSRSRE